jgi:2-succinyl-5-enolpyruvyl-6-hydroxy-3-cyclohexene-1-carboxylate synthase
VSSTTLPAADPAATQAWCRAFLAQLVACGVQHVAVSPGSRSTPITVAADRTDGLDLSVHLDERSGGFFALGLARATRRPVAVLCTSGTAAANYLPAVVEAFQSGVPLLVLTTDRPPELRGIGAPQTIDQVGLYGTHTRWAANVGTAGSEAPGEAASLAHQAVVRATRPAPGPVHVNIGLREPLEPPAGNPPPVGLLPMPPDHATVEPGPLPDLLGIEQGLLVAGPMDLDDRGVEAIAELSRRTGWPILADPASGLRRGPHTSHAPVVAGGDHLLRSSWADDHRPDVVVQMGAMPTSKGYRLWLDRVGTDRLVAVDHLGRHPDAAHRVTDRVAAEPGRLAAELLLHVDDTGRNGPWSTTWTDADTIAMSTVIAIADDGPFDEPGVVTTMHRCLPTGANLVVANSMPIRDLDAFLPTGERPLRILANRGANGIDGLASTALGVAAGSPEPTVLFTGDLTLLHDLGGLLATRRLGLDLTVVLVDNDGGGIFSFLPIADSRQVDHHRLFHTPHGLDLGGVATLAGGRLHQPTDAIALQEVLGSTLRSPGLDLVRVTVDATTNVGLHRAASASVQRVLMGIGG